METPPAGSRGGRQSPPMPYTVGQGVRVYYETEGQSPSLVLGHGGDSLDMWRRAGYTDALRDELELVLLDFRGHGRSSGTRESPEHKGGTSADVLAVMDSLHLEKAYYMGCSAGASAGFALAAHCPERFRSFILGGMTPYAWPDTMIKAVRVSTELYGLLLAEPLQYLFRMEQMLRRPLTPEDREHFLSQDAEARTAGLTALISGPMLTDDQLRAIMTP